jgi:gliding motility-associated-like protein
LHQGTLIQNANGTITYRPDEGFIGTVQFIYEICDSGNPTALCAQATVTINVLFDPNCTPPPPPPILVVGCELLIPNGFSPNNDNINDYFEIVLQLSEGEKTFVEDYQNAKMYIYNRWGNLLYEKNNYGNTDVWGNTDAWWDGYSQNSMTVGGDKLPGGTYVYVLILDDGTVLKGTVFVNY